MASFTGDFAGKIVANTALASTVGVHDPEVVARCAFSNQLSLRKRKQPLQDLLLKQLRKNSSFYFIIHFKLAFWILLKTSNVFPFKLDKPNMHFRFDVMYMWQIASRIWANYIMYL
jgi:hypothetical protein